MDSDTPLLSVVMPTRNQVVFVERAIASVLAQQDGLGGALELVVVDGASTDGTPALLAALAARHTGRIRWFSEPDLGPADAVNKAVKLARAPFVGWLNSDDLYTPGAATRAIHALRARPDLVMVYGEGEHIDVEGKALGRYPSLGADAPLSSWRDGCPVCQPTAFFRREVFSTLGGLDRSLRTAFDFDLWLRMALAYPGRIGFVQQVQACSRLHADGITARMRETVAMEGLRVVAKHLGVAPIHWLLTYADELLHRCPDPSGTEPSRRHLLSLVDDAARWLGAEGATELRSRLAAHAGWRLARDTIVADVHADGWAPPHLHVRLRPAAPAPTTLWLRGRNASPVKGLLAIEMTWPGRQATWQQRELRPGPFELAIPLPDGIAVGETTQMIISSTPCFTPSRITRGSTDSRDLAFLVDEVRLA